MSEIIPSLNLPSQILSLTGSITQSKIISRLDHDMPTEVDKNELEKICSEFESLFIYHLLKTMRNTIPKSGFIGGGRGQEVYTSMLDQHLSGNISRQRGIGIASALMRQIVPKN